MTVYGEKRKVITFNLDNEQQRELFAFAQSIDFSREVKQFLALRMRGISLSEVISEYAKSHHQ